MSAMLNPADQTQCRTTEWKLGYRCARCLRRAAMFDMHCRRCGSTALPCEVSYRLHRPRLLYRLFAWMQGLPQPRTLTEYRGE